MCEDCVLVVIGFFGNVFGSFLDGDIGCGYMDFCVFLVVVGFRVDEF